MSEYANPGSLVSTDWLVAHVNDPDLRVLDVDEDTEAYRLGHIPGSLGSTGGSTCRPRSTVTS